MAKKKERKVKKGSGRKIPKIMAFALAGVVLVGAGAGLFLHFKNDGVDDVTEPPATETVTSNFYNNVLTYNFEDRETGAFTISTGLHLNGATGEVVEPSALNGNKSLQLTSSVTGATADWNTMLESAFSPKVGQRYLVSMKLKYTMPTELSTGIIAVRLVEKDGPEDNGLFVSIGRTDAHHLNARSDEETMYVYDESTGIFSLNVYMTAQSSAQEVHLTTVGGGTWTVVVDDFSITEVTTTVKTVEK